jgi:oligoendopeptidase F
MNRIFPAIRKVTGRGHLYHAYVYLNNRPVVACSHRHRTVETATKCAEKMYRKYLRSLSKEQIRSEAK